MLSFPYRANTSYFIRQKLMIYDYEKDISRAVWKILHDFLFKKNEFLYAYYTFRCKKKPKLLFITPSFPHLPSSLLCKAINLWKCCRLLHEKWNSQKRHLYCGVVFKIDSNTTLPFWLLFQPILSYTTSFPTTGYIIEHHYSRETSIRT